MTDSPQPPVPSSPEQIARIRKSRNTVLGLLLGAFVVLVFAISIVKLTAQ